MRTKGPCCRCADSTVMSSVPVLATTATAAAEACANCGREGDGDVVKLRNCNACFLVKYCSVDCQKVHRKQHKKACKERAAQLKDEKLYGQGHERTESEFCPLCLLAVPFPTQDHSKFYACCMKRVCNGCCLAAGKTGLGEICPFCRTPSPGNDDEALGMVQKRVAARDPEAIFYLGDVYLNGMYGMGKDPARAFRLWTEAAELGATAALCKMGFAYMNGMGVAQDKARAVSCWESAAMQGCAGSRQLLGAVEGDDGRYDRALRHFLISAKMGFEDALDAIKYMLAHGHATKPQYAEALKGYRDALEETKSHDRDEALGV